jgi:hypothetical protein
MCAFALNGCPVYGIESAPEPLNFLREFWKELSLDKNQPLQIIEGDYLNPDIGQKKFPDGTKLSDIDIFYSYHGGVEHDQNILVRVLAGPGKAKIGSIARLGGAFGQDEAPVLKEIGYEVIIPGPDYKPLIRKVDSIAPDEGIIYRLNNAYKMNS